jgi:CoA:oxalate CoA-transferase
MADTLDGIRVLDVTLAAAGPFCARILADLGAEVIHVEWPRVRWAALGDARPATRFPEEGLRSDHGTQLFAHTNAGKKSLAVNLKTQEGVEIVKELAKTVDVVIENMTPRVMEGFGLSYEVLSVLNPMLVMCSITGFGQAGLDGDSSRPCVDPVVQAMSGMSWITGERTGSPYAIGGAIGDTAASIVGVAGILAALVGRRATGLGQYIDLSMVESLAYLDSIVLPRVAMSEGGLQPCRNGQLNTFLCPMGPFRAPKGYIAIQAAGSGSDSPWGRLCVLMGRDELISDPRFADDARRVVHVEEVIRIIETWLAQFDDREAPLALLAAERISCGPVLSQIEMLSHSFFAERQTFGQVEYPNVGPVKVVEPPFHFSGSTAVVRGPAPELGAHSREIVRQYLGRSEDQINALMSADVLYETVPFRPQSCATDDFSSDLMP